ncbi:MAG: hypothetical protein LKF52_10860 [Butyrivibrio sp.]|jgi:hypothetical protein|nr:hypothetical protein [Butyrivibrio sp.]
MRHWVRTAAAMVAATTVLSACGAGAQSGNEESTHAVSEASASASAENAAVSMTESTTGQSIQESSAEASDAAAISVTASSPDGVFNQEELMAAANVTDQQTKTGWEYTDTTSTAFTMNTGYARKIGKQMVGNGLATFVNDGKVTLDVMQKCTEAASENPEGSYTGSFTVTVADGSKTKVPVSFSLSDLYSYGAAVFTGDTQTDSLSFISVALGTPNPYLALIQTPEVTENKGITAGKELSEEEAAGIASVYGMCFKSDSCAEIKASAEENAAQFGTPDKVAVYKNGTSDIWVLGYTGADYRMAVIAQPKAEVTDIAKAVIFPNGEIGDAVFNALFSE